jgi:hypothetical protein
MASILFNCLDSHKQLQDLRSAFLFLGGFVPMNMHQVAGKISAGPHVDLHAVALVVHVMFGSENMSAVFSILLLFRPSLCSVLHPAVVSSLSLSNISRHSQHTLRLYGKWIMTWRLRCLRLLLKATALRC